MLGPKKRRPRSRAICAISLSNSGLPDSRPPALITIAPAAPLSAASCRTPGTNLAGTAITTRSRVPGMSLTLA